jgi:hypothetical protein
MLRRSSSLGNYQTTRRFIPEDNFKDSFGFTGQFLENDQEEIYLSSSWH